MTRTRKTWAHTIVRSDAHTVTVMSPDLAHPDFDVEVAFRVTAATADDAATMAYQTLELEDFLVTTEAVEDGFKVTCALSISATTPEEANEVIVKAWKGTPAWRSVLHEVEMFANYTALA